MVWADVMRTKLENFRELDKTFNKKSTVRFQFCAILILYSFKLLLPIKNNWKKCKLDTQKISKQWLLNLLWNSRSTECQSFRNWVFFISRFQIIQFDFWSKISITGCLYLSGSTNYVSVERCPFVWGDMVIFKRGTL